MINTSDDNQDNFKFSGIKGRKRDSTALKDSSCLKLWLSNA